MNKDNVLYVSIGIILLFVIAIALFFFFSIKIELLASESLVYPVIAIGLAILVALLHTFYIYGSEMKEDEFMNKLKRKSAYYSFTITRYLIISVLILMSFSYQIHTTMLWFLLLIVPTIIQAVIEIYLKRNPEKV